MNDPARTIPGRPGPDRATAVRKAFFGPLTRLLNPRVLKVAGTAERPRFGVVEHRGRRSGRTHATPLGVRGFRGGFLIPLTFGAQADWCRNVLAAGGCDIEWKGMRWAATEPEVVESVDVLAELRAATGPVERLLLRMMGTRRFLRLRAVASERAR